MLRRLLAGRGRSDHTVPAPTKEKARLLLVDDDGILLGFLAETLRDHGYEVVTATDGAEGLDKALTGRPDAIVLDRTMPGLDGFEVLQRLKRDRRTAGIPVLMVTSCTASEEVAYGLALGAVEYLTKPILSGDVVRQVARMLGSSFAPAPMATGSVVPQSR
ncbi:response regulator [Benzoatithermus flavus]|uniref:Response regulator n=1 Tax=Benzoatithermus flavus TaxID=3108223 RepID=A0ABU8XWK5_9PROT